MFVRVHAPGQDAEFLKGRYSESFISLLSKQIEEEIARVMSVCGLSESKIELQLVFAPGTYMEHTSENVTYRRLLLVDDASRPRDFWVKWTRLDGGVGYTVSDDVTADTVRFELGEDVPQKIREKEYRFLCSANPDKYQSAMGKKTVTEWRDIIKRAIKYGELTKLATPVYTPPAPQPSESFIPDAVPVIPDASLQQRDEPIDDLTARLAELLKLEDSEPEAEEYQPEQSKEESFDNIVELARAALLKYGEDKEPTEEIDLSESESEPEDELEIDEQIDELETEEPEDEIIEAEELDLAYAKAPASYQPTTQPVMPDEDSIRAEIEAKIRLEYENRAREMAEKMAQERERHERELLLAEEKHKKTAEELRQKIEAQMQREARERDRLTEAARQAVLEQRQLEREAEPRIEEPIPAPAPMLTPAPAPAPAPVLVSAPIAKTGEPQWLEPKHARLIFRNAVPTGTISAIKSIVEKTLIDEGKEHIHMHIKAYPIDANTVGMDIIKMPANERDLIVTIMKALGRGGLGITKITVE